MATLVIGAFSSAANDAGGTSSPEAWSEERLVAAAQSGQRAAFGELCERHAKRILRVTQRITRNREDAEDAVQDSFLSAFVHLKDFDGRSRFATWLTRIAINSALAKLRKRRGIREVPMEETNSAAEPAPLRREFPDSAPNPEETYHRRERRRLVSEAIGGLRPRTRRVIEFHQLREHSIKETAQILGISTAAVKSRMFHAKVALRRMPLLKSAGNSIWVSAD